MTIEDPLIDVPVLETKFPLLWQSLNESINEIQIFEQQQKNKQLLLVILGSDLPAVDNEESGVGQNHELRILNTKIDFMLTLISQLVINNSPLPDKIKVKLSSKGLVFSTTDLLDENGLVSFQCFISQEIPQPLKLVAQILSIDANKTNYTITTSFIGIGDEVSNLLDKYIFRRHRRSVAQQRKQP